MRKWIKFFFLDIGQIERAFLNELSSILKNSESDAQLLS